MLPSAAEQQSKGAVFRDLHAGPEPFVIPNPWNVGTAQILTGLGFPSQLKEFVKNGTMKSFALWDVEKLGYLTAYAGAALASGQITGAEGEKFKAGDMGEFTVGANGVVLLGDPTVFTADNVDKFNF